MDRALLADRAETRIGRLAGDQRGDDLLLVRNDDAEDVDRHDRADEGADMDQRAAPGKDVGEDVRRADDEDEHRQRQQPVLLPIADLHSRS